MLIAPALFFLKGLSRLIMTRDAAPAPLLAWLAAALLSRYRNFDHKGVTERAWRIDQGQVLVRVPSNPPPRPWGCRKPDFGSTSILETL